jgi:outer membrane protein
MLLPAVAALLFGTPAGAQGIGPGDDDDDESSWGLGIGVANSQKPYAGIGRQTRAIPMIQFENRYVRIMGPGVEVKLPSLALSDTQALKFSLVGRRNMGGGYEADDAPILAGMAERKGGFWVGAKVEWKTDLLNLGAEASADASGHSKGRKFGLGVSKPWHLGRQFMLVPRLGVTWYDRKHNDYYFGVRDAEARPDRPAYRAGAGTNVEVGLNGLYMFDRHHSAMLGVSANSLSRPVKDSPLVGRSSESRVFLAYVHRF